MSLLTEMSDSFEMIDRTTVSDGYGGYITEWVVGATIKASVSLDNSIDAQTALANGVTGVYTIITPRNVVLQYHDVLRRVTDGKVFRVTSDGDDKRTPPSAGLKLRAVSAEEWTIPGTIPEPEANANG